MDTRGKMVLVCLWHLKNRLKTAGITKIPMQKLSMQNTKGHFKGRLDVPKTLKHY